MYGFEDIPLGFTRNHIPSVIHDAKLWRLSREREPFQESPTKQCTDESSMGSNTRSLRSVRTALGDEVNHEYRDTEAACIRPLMENGFDGGSRTSILDLFARRRTDFKNDAAESPTQAWGEQVTDRHLPFSKGMILVLARSLTDTNKSTVFVDANPLLLLCGLAVSDWYAKSYDFIEVFIENAPCWVTVGPVSRETTRLAIRTPHTQAVIAYGNLNSNVGLQMDKSTNLFTALASLRVRPSYFHAFQHTTMQQRQTLCPKPKSWVLARQEARHPPIWYDLAHPAFL